MKWTENKTLTEMPIRISEQLVYIYEIALLALRDPRFKAEVIGDNLDLSDEYLDYILETLETYLGNLDAESEDEDEQTRP